MTALSYATYKGRLEIVKLLIDSGANIEAVDSVSNKSLVVTVSTYFTYVMFKINESIYIYYGMCNFA